MLSRSRYDLRFLREIDHDISNQNVIYIDNQGTNALAHNPEHHAHTKHVDIQYHFVRNCVEDEMTSWNIVQRKI